MIRTVIAPHLVYVHLAYITYINAKLRFFYSRRATFISIKIQNLHLYPSINHPCRRQRKVQPTDVTPPPSQYAKLSTAANWPPIMHL